jgi:hypothetical protein
MAIHKNVSNKNLDIKTGASGIKLKEITSTPTIKNDPLQIISGYAGDVKKSVFVGGAAIVLELILYFSKIIK